MWSEVIQQRAGSTCMEEEDGFHAPPSLFLCALSPLKVHASRWESRFRDRWDQTLRSPQRDLDGQISVNRNGEEAEDGALSEDQDEAGEEEAPVKIHIKAHADGDRKRHGEAAHQDIRHGQRHQKVVGGVFQSAVDGDRPAHQDVSRYREKCDHNFYNDVERVHLMLVRFRTHDSHRSWSCAFSPRGASGGPGVLRGWLPSDSKGLESFGLRSAEDAGGKLARPRGVALAPLSACKTHFTEPAHLCWALSRFQRAIAGAREEHLRRKQRHATAAPPPPHGTFEKRRKLTFRDATPPVQNHTRHMNVTKVSLGGIPSERHASWLNGVWLLHPRAIAAQCMRASQSLHLVSVFHLVWVEGGGVDKVLTILQNSTEVWN